MLARLTPVATLITETEVVEESSTTYSIECGKENF